MATRKTKRKSELSQAGDHLGAAARELGTAVSHKMDTLGDAVSAGISRARKEVLTRRDRVGRQIGDLVKMAEARLKEAQVQLERAGRAAHRSVTAAEKQLEATRRSADRKLTALRANAERKAKALQKAVEKEAAALKKTVRAQTGTATAGKPAGGKPAAKKPIAKKPIAKQVRREEAGREASPSRRSPSQKPLHPASPLRSSRRRPMPFKATEEPHRAATVCCIIPLPMESATVSRLPSFAFDNSYARELEGAYVPWKPSAAPAPRLVRLNRPLAEELRLDADALASADGVAVLAGNAVPEGAQPIAQAYAGHQFGGFSPQLGDGRALLLGEVIDRAGRRRDIAFKGSGRTPFSRGGDGKAALGPVLREYLMGEAMHALGIPTTRVLAAVATGRTGVPRNRAAGRPARPGRGQPPAGRHLRVLCRSQRRRACCGGWRTTQSHATTRTWRAATTGTSRCCVPSPSGRRHSWRAGCRSVSSTA